MHKKVDLVLLSSLSPILYGIYKNKELVMQFESQEKTLDVLTKLYSLIEEYEVERIFYAKGPGSFTAIKLTHIFLQTLHIAKGIHTIKLDSFCNM